MNRCTACGCYEEVRPPQLWCRHHERRLPEATREALARSGGNTFERAQLVNDAIRYLTDTELRSYAHAV